MRNDETCKPITVEVSTHSVRFDIPATNEDEMNLGFTLATADAIELHAALNAALASVPVPTDETDETPRIHGIWHPLFDQPITVRLSREQLQCVQDALLGRTEPFAGWNAHFAGEVERVLVDSLASASTDKEDDK